MGVLSIIETVLCKYSPSFTDMVQILTQNPERILTQLINFSFFPSLSRTTSEVTNNLRMRSRFAKPKPNLKKILGTSRFGAHREVPSLFVTKEVEIRRGKLYCSPESYKITLTQEISLAFQMEYSVVTIILTIKKLKHTESRMSYKINTHKPAN